jgi:uracil-DNA glycosylase
MRTVILPDPDDFEAWRDAARTLILLQVPPDQIIWQNGTADDLFATTDPLPKATGTIPVPRAFVNLAQSAICHSAPDRFSLLYTLLWRLQTQRALITDYADPLVRRIDDLAKSVRRDIHKMRAFVRFREVDGRYVAWFEPDHHVVRANAAFFVRRFASMQWSILTPVVSIHWDGKTLAEQPGAEQKDAPDGDPVEDVWKSYYASIFNPARVKIGAMTKEMPKKYWKNMPETALIPGLIQSAKAREAGMIDRQTISGDTDAAWAGLRDEAR